jgi:hypothetical protein
VGSGRRKDAHCLLPSAAWGCSRSERWQVVVGLGWANPVIVSRRSGGDAPAAVLGAAAAACGQHRGPLGAVVQWWIGFGCRYSAGGPVDRLRYELELHGLAGPTGHLRAFDPE